MKRWTSWSQNLCVLNFDLGDWSPRSPPPPPPHGCSHRLCTYRIVLSEGGLCSEMCDLMKVFDSRRVPKSVVKLWVEKYQQRNRNCRGFRWAVKCHVR